MKIKKNNLKKGREEDMNATKTLRHKHRRQQDRKTARQQDRKTGRQEDRETRRQEHKEI